MILRELTLNRFKSFEEAHFRFGALMNAFTGNNGAGKTNILDAIYLLAFGKSYFNLRLSQLINHGHDFFSVKGVFANDQSEESILINYRKGEKKTIKRNGKAYEKLSEHIGLIPLVMISPYDRDLISERGETRRKFLDKLIAQFDKNYLADLVAYQRYLTHRNSLLKYFAVNQTFDAATLSVYNEKLVQYGNSIYRKRKEFMERFRPFLAEKYRWLSAGSEQADVRYHSALDKHSFVQLLEENLNRDRLLQYTSAGIHRDDLIFELDGYPIKHFGSQGQQKSFLIALRLAEYEMLKNRKQTAPILLFDDIFDKLDAQRVEKIVRWTEEGSFGQVFLTDTHAERINRLFKNINGKTEIFPL